MKLTKRHKALINNRMRRAEVLYNSLSFTCNLIHTALGFEPQRIYADFFNFRHVSDDVRYSSTVNEDYVFKLPKPERTQLRSLLLTVFMETYNDIEGNDKKGTL